MAQCDQGRTPDRRTAGRVGSVVTVAGRHAPWAARAVLLAASVVGPVLARAQTTSDSATAPAATPVAPSAPVRGGLLARLARGIDHANAVATSVRLAKATPVDLTARGLQPVPYGGATLGVSSMELREGAGVRLHVYVHNAGAEPLAVPAPSAALFALIDDRGRALTAFGSLYPESGRAPAVANGTLTLPALERVAYVLLFAAPAADAAELALRVTGAGVVRGIPAHVSATTTPAAAVEPAPAPPTPAPPPDR